MLACSMPLSREEQLRLVEAARTGTPAERAAAHRELLDFFRPYAMAVVQRTLAAAGVGREHAEEAWLQATFRMFTVGLERFSGGAAPLSYFLRITLHAAVDVVRSVLRPPLPGPDATADPLTERVEAEEHWRTLEALRACLAALSAEHAEAVRLYYLEEAGSCAECAARLGLSPAAFMKRLERARTSLEGCVSARLGGAGRRRQDG